MKDEIKPRHSWTDNLGGLGLATVIAVFAWGWYDSTFNVPMTPICAYMIDAHPVGLDASLDALALDAVMRCRLDKLRYGQKD